EVARNRMRELIAEIETRLTSLTARIERNGEAIDDPEWTSLTEAIREIDRLAGSSTPRQGRWRDLSRHLAFAQAVDLHDIADHDWPSVLVDISASFYAETEAMPVHVDDLGELADTHPAGRVSIRLNWQALDDEGFERLVFNLISTAAH